jgi:hypothetical protein
MLGLREGLTVANASNLFDASFQRTALIECGCNMHARRYFVMALDAGDQRAALPLAAYKKLYEIEAEIRDRDPDMKLAERRARSKPVWDELVAWCEVRKPYEPPSSGLGKALRYLTNHKVALGRFLEYGYVPLDNGIVERLHVRAALTRKNFLFAGADSGGERAAIAFTIFGSCRLAGVDPIEYLADVLPRLTGQIGCVTCRRSCQRGGLPRVPLRVLPQPPRPKLRRSACHDYGPQSIRCRGYPGAVHRALTRQPPVGARGGAIAP